MAVLKPFQLLEINVISAQDLEPVSTKMKTYAIAWVHPTRKLISGLDKDGNVDPTWNDKFVFRVDEEFFYQDASAVHIEIYCVHWLRDTLIGAVSILVGNLCPARFTKLDTRFVALQVRRPSGRPQGILNIGVALLDSSIKSMPLYRQPSVSADGYRNLLPEELHHHHHYQENINQNHNNNKNQISAMKPKLWHTKSERSDKSSTINGSIVGIPFKNGPIENDGSLLSISNEPPPLRIHVKKKGKASSVTGCVELRDMPKIETNVKGGSVLSDSIVSKDSTMYMARHEQSVLKQCDPTVENKILSPNEKAGKGAGVGLPVTIGKHMPKYNLFEESGSSVNQKFVYGTRGGSIWSGSEVEPSQSEVAAVMAKYPLREDQSSVLDGWSVDESSEGFKSKLERWRTELPPIYDSRYPTASTSHYRSSQHRIRRRHSDGESAGMFSCFGNIIGYECQCVCGQPPEHKSRCARYQTPSY